MKRYLLPFSVAAALLAWHGPASAQLTQSCQYSCGTFGDRQSCNQCLKLKSLEDQKLPTDTRSPLAPSPKSGFEQWQNERTLEQLQNSERQYRQNCIQFGGC
jgi:hypothetical protein